jgi:sugar phosphate isomerase/epimerase
MKIAGHTMGTPEYSLPEAIQLFAGMGLDGIEIIIQTDGYKCALGLDDPESQIDATRRQVADAGLAVAGLTPYMNRFNSLDESARQADCADLRKVIAMAKRLAAPCVRVYGGKLVTGEDDPDGAKLDRLVRSMRECGDYAGECGVKLCLENHFGTMTTSAARTAEILRAIDHPAVGVLYDQANIAFFPAEEYQEALALLAGRIYHVHVKDLVYREGAGPLVCSEVATVDESVRTVHSRIPGEGILDWPAILKGLVALGYDGWLSLEYERRWQTIDLPEAAVGMARAHQYIRSCLAALG